ncbi:LacI family DNA-binding transcriptional regulator [Streptomyces himalayensis]|uniref:LacI family DNA-binding transcriptional regulator n=1 Tax=Streptomyces himalayensis subsp. himalayensis TaxID=2756131 RepID=A0A7W0IAD1_9ACTN|nr:LacI family DNA-binding transcriptional regulator [Streptomyces himalayensis]MBA2948004.1 LacI family DNA-binding transcriptional regulator [Streptomyces himalayensis subsp. himalayensis]
MTREPHGPDSGRSVIRRPASIKDVAAAARVSPTTVSHVLSGNRPVNEQTAARVRSVVNRLGYVPASLARSLQAGSTSVIGLMIPDISNTFFAELAKGAEDAAHDLGYGVILCNTEFDAEREDRYLGMIRSRFIDGMVYASGSPPSRRRLEALMGRFPIALADEEVDGLEGALIATADHEAGGRLVGEHLRELGHRRALMLTGPRELKSGVARAGGFVKAFQGQVTERVGDFKEYSGYRLVSELLAAGDPDFTAVFAANDLMAFGALLALREAGLSVPHDVSVVGFDDIRAASLAHPSLTTVHQPAYDVGRTATAQLLQYVTRGEVPPASRHTLPVELKVRASTAPPAR